MKVIIIESYMEGGGRQVCPTRGTARDSSGHERSKGSDPAGLRVGHTRLPSPSMLDSFSCLYHPKCTCYKKKTSKSREMLQCLTTFAFMLMMSAKFGSYVFRAWHVYWRWTGLKMRVAYLTPLCADKEI